jgi:hypothetical protein
MEEAAPDREPDNSSGKGATSRQSPDASGSVAVAVPPVNAPDAGDIQLPVWTKALGWCGTAGLIYLLICAVSIISRGFAGLGADAGTEDLAYARRIAQLRNYYFDHAPELAGYLLNPAERLPTPGLGIRLWQQFLTVAGMVAVITAVLAGSAGGLLAAVAFGHSLIAALVAGVVVAAAVLTGLMRYQNSTWIRGSTTSLFPGT